jgi:Protein of unknown function (DUF3006).
MTHNSPLDGTFTAVVDRFEEDLAVLVIEDDDETVGEYVTSAGNLPEDGQKVDAVLTATFEEGEIINVSFDENETEQRDTNMKNRLDRLSQRPSDPQKKHTDDT